MAYCTLREVNELAVDTKKKVNRNSTASVLASGALLDYLSSAKQTMRDNFTP